MRADIAERQRAEQRRARTAEFVHHAAGARGLSNGQSGEGRAYLFVGSASGLGASPAWTVEANLAGAALGTSVASAGNVDGSGYDQVIVGAPGYTVSGSAVGAAFAYAPLTIVDADLDPAPIGGAVRRRDVDSGLVAANVRRLAKRGPQIGIR